MPNFLVNSRRKSSQLFCAPPAPDRSWSQVGNACLKGNLVRVIEVAVNLGVNRLTAVSPTAERRFGGRATMIIDGGRVIDSQLRRLGLRRSELEHAVRLHGCKTVMTSVKWTAAGSNPAGSWC